MPLDNIPNGWYKDVINHIGEVAMEFADQVKYVRKQLKLSQEKLASLLGVSFATVNRWETGHSMPTYKTQQSFIALCKESKINFEE